jgi:hypothetical protein
MLKMTNESKQSFPNRKLIGITAAIMVVLGTALIFLLSPPQPSQPKAALIDQLGSSKLSTFSRHQNQTFVATAEELLYARFSAVDYYSDNASVDNYKSLSSQGYKLIIWRVHSALDLNSKYIAISTSERYGSKSYDQYSSDQLTLCNITGDPRLYFAITPKFIEECMNGRFEDTVIVLMSCNGLKKEYEKTAEAFIQKGAKAFISWDGWIESRDNDQAITLLLQYLIIQNSTVGEAVSRIPSFVSLAYESSKLDYYPHTDVAGYTIPDYRQEKTTTSAGFAQMPIPTDIKIKANRLKTERNSDGGRTGLTC